MCLWKGLCWKFSGVKCLLLPAPEQLLSSSLGVFPSFPEGTQLVPKLPGAYGSLHNLTPGCWSSSRAQLLWTATRKAAVQAHRPCLATQELSLEGRGRSYSPPGYCRTLRGQAGKRLESTDRDLPYWICRTRLLGAFWSPSEQCYELRLAYRFLISVAWYGEESERWAVDIKLSSSRSYIAQHLCDCERVT